MTDLASILDPAFWGTLVAQGGALATFAFRVAPYLGRPVEKLLMNKTEVLNIRERAQAERDAGQHRSEVAITAAATDARVKLLAEHPEIVLNQLPPVQQRAFQTIIDRETRHQENRDAVVREAIPLITDSANPDSVDDEWFEQFFDMASKVNDDSVRKAVGKLLAGKVNRPASYSKRMLRIVADMESADAELFGRLLQYLVAFRDSDPRLPQASMILMLGETDPEHGIIGHSEHGMTDSDLSHLSTIDLIRYEAGLNFRISPIGEWSIAYGERVWIMEKLTDDDRSTLGDPALWFGSVQLTNFGEELATLYDNEYPPNIREHITALIEKSGYRILRMSDSGRAIPTYDSQD